VSEQKRKRGRFSPPAQSKHNKIVVSTAAGFVHLLKTSREKQLQPVTLRNGRHHAATRRQKYDKLKKL